MSVFRTEEGREMVRGAVESILEQATCPLRRREISTPAGLTHVVEAGSPEAPALLALHGTSSNAASWLGELPVLAKHFRVIAPDIPGEPGLSEDRRLSLRDREHRAWIGSILEELEVERAHLLGMSLGGWAALDFALNHPARVERVALIAPSGLARPRLSFFLKVLPLAFLGQWGSDRINAIVYGQESIPEEAREFGRLVAKHYRPLTEGVPIFEEAPLSELDVPLLYLAGAQDALLDTRRSAQRLRCVRGAEVEILPGAGHVVLGQHERLARFFCAQ